MTTPSPETMTPAQEAWFDYRKDYGSWNEPELSQVHKHFTAGYEAATAALSAAYPLMEASAKAEALREAGADSRVGPVPYGWNASGVASWLRDRAATIEREAFLAEAINDPEGQDLAQAAKELATPNLGNWPTPNKPTPPLVDVIAEVLAEHLIGGETEGMGDFAFLCTCGYDDGIGGDWDEAGKLIAAHQARAVLDALAKAGGVEWAVVLDGLTYMFDSHEFDIAKRFLGHHGGQLSERTKAGPWAAVEG